MKIEYYLLLLSCLCYICHVRAECCYKKAYSFINNNKSKKCSDYDGASNIYDNVMCSISLCNNGAPPQNWYCGIGDCNAFGCNCDYGCLPGDAKLIFSLKHGKDISNVI